ncbi:MAG: hypothetical protein DSM106950_35285 [Stigonema ocellatum SAG 48.90 = DSM 106950]|nr:hypothetical protein [Stigonema ocellatum SAG 48.90 = DSM 106950]
MNIANSNQDKQRAATIAIPTHEHIVSTLYCTRTRTEHRYQPLGFEITVQKELSGIGTDERADC